MRIGVLIFAVLTLTLSGCANVRERIFGNAQQASLPYRAVLTKGEDRRNFAVRVRAGGVSVPDVRESVRFQATRYCLTTFGGSDARWAIDPSTGDWAFAREGEDMIFTGRCLAR